MNGKEVAERLGISRNYIFRDIRLGRLKAQRGKMHHWEISEEDFLDYAEKYKASRLHPELLTLKETARLLNVSYGTLIVYIRKGHIVPDVDTPYYRRFRPETVEAFLEKRLDSTDIRKRGRSLYCKRVIRPEEDEVHDSGAIIHWSERFRSDDLTYVPVTCTRCGVKFDKLDGHLNKGLHDDSFTGGCGRCSAALAFERNPLPLKSGGRITRRGYTFCHIRTFSDEERTILEPMLTGRQKYIAEHRALIALSLSRTLGSDEQVHHIDGNKLNNDLGNLILRNPANHRQTHHELMNELARLQAENEALHARLQKLLDC